MGNVHREWVQGKHDRVTVELSGWLLLVQVPVGPHGSHLRSKVAMVRDIMACTEGGLLTGVLIYSLCVLAVIAEMSAIMSSCSEMVYIWKVPYSTVGVK